MKNLKPVAKAVIIVAVCVGAVYVLGRGLLYASVDAKLNEEIALLKAEAGSLKLKDIGSQVWGSRLLSSGRLFPTHDLEFKFQPPR